MTMPPNIQADYEGVYMPLFLWERLLYCAQLGTPMYGPPYVSEEFAREARQAWDLANQQING